MTADIPQIHPTRDIDLSRFGREGHIVLQAPDFRRLTALRNTVMPYTLTEQQQKDFEGLDAESRKKMIDEVKRMPAQFATLQAITALGYITEAPWHLNDYKKLMILDVDAFFEWLGMDGDIIYKEIMAQIDSLGRVNPLS